MLSKKFLGKLTATFVSIVMMGATTVFSANASEYAPPAIDNDPVASSGNSAYGNGFSYMGSSSCYNGDAEIASSGSSSYFYQWVHPEISFGGTRTVKVELSVYLNHASFTDPSARYTVYQNGASLTIGTVNQNLAASGWNALTPKTSSNFTQLKMVTVHPSTYSGYYTGADAVLVKYTY